MGNCLITRLKESVNNDNLPFFDTIAFDITYMEDATVNNTNFGFVANGPVRVFTSSGGSFKPDGEDSYVQSKEYNPQVDTSITFTLANGSYKLYIKGRSNIIELLNSNSVRNYNQNLASLNVEEMFWLNNLNAIRLQGISTNGKLDFNDWTSVTEIYTNDASEMRYLSNMDVEVSNLAKGTSLQNIVIFKGNNNTVKGNIEELENLINLEVLKLRYNTTVNGELKTLCDALWANGKRGQITFELRDTGCTYNGDPIGDFYVFTFTNEGWS